ncbi:MAG: TIGR03752 family integrating conjugative element protein [Candidatus Accumulibacter sp.]|jgi:integrating conjugative element protein (TIGR03752 family)|nr:TIGR03752 family integrating conjugative element protein [Accumulibacter sp.]
MHANPLLKWLLAPLVVLVAVVGFKLASGPREKVSPDAVSQLTPEEMKALGIEGDTPRDTVATLVAQVKQLRGELRGALDGNQEQKTENERLRAREGTIDQRIRSALEGERKRLQQEREQLANERRETQELLRNLERRVEKLPDGQSADLPVGLGLEEGDGKRFGGQPGNGNGLRWVEPEDARPQLRIGSGGSAGAPGFPTSFAPAQKTLTSDLDRLADAGQESAQAGVKPVYTVPANATLMGSVAMTALIGRIPIDGTVNDPYPFKVLIGPDNLTANGIDLPDVAGAVVSGTASGDWTLSCVRGQVRSVTFVFQDGTVRTVPEEGRGQNNNNRSATQGGLGWISDPHGIPCVSGEQRSNARQYLGSQALITAAGAGAASLIQSDGGSVALVSSSDGSLGTVGISGNEAMGRILAGGVRDMADWVNKLYGQAFAAVYVPPGAKVAVHLEQPLYIDYDPRGRRVDHAFGENHAPDLD